MYNDETLIDIDDDILNGVRGRAGALHLDWLWVVLGFGLLPLSVPLLKLYGYGQFSSMQCVIGIVSDEYTFYLCRT